jgi:hypothetical protein
VAPAHPPDPAASGSPPPARGSQAIDKFVAAMKSVDWNQLGKDFQTFGKRVAVSDFARISPEPHEMSAVASHGPRMAALVVWRRALLILACVLTALMLLKRCFDPFTFQSAFKDTQIEELKEQNPNAKSSEIKEAAEANTKQFVETAGESNVNIINAILIVSFLTIIAGLGFQILAAMRWRQWKVSRKLALLAAGVVLVPQLLAMLIPWSAMMDFGHLETRVPAGLEGVTGTMSPAQAKMVLQIFVVAAVLGTAIPLFYGLFNGVLRASLATKTLVPASIVCGWGTMLLALTISVPWFIILSIVDQMQADVLIFIGVLCLFIAPLSIILRSRRLGAPLTPEEATSIVRKARLLLAGLNAAGAILLLIYLNEENLVGVSQTITVVIQYFANLLLIQVVAVDMLVLLLDRAHRKLAADPAPDESLRQLGEVLPKA